MPAPSPGQEEQALPIEGWTVPSVPAEAVDALQTGTPEVAEAQAPRTQDQLREMLGLEPLGWTLPAAVRLRGWIVTAVAGLIAALTRFWGLSHPHTLVFDEIYYVKDAYSLWHLGYEATWAEGADQLFPMGDVSTLGTNPSYVVHPQLGKWLLGLGTALLGPQSSLGWRLVPALTGVATVILLARLTMRLTKSPLLAGLAGFLLAIDGVGITESRIGLLDVLIGFFATLSVYFMVRDRQWSRACLAADLAGTPPGHLASKAHVRPWLIATGVTLGLCCSVKWSGLYLLAAIGVLVVVWDTLALRRVQAKAWLLEGVVSRGFGDFIRLVPVAFLVYVAGWFSWFMHDDAYKRGWAAAQRAATGTVPRSWLPDPLNDLLEYHLSMYSFHVSLDSPHPYMSKPIGWLVQWRPTSFYWPSEEEMRGASCGSERCVQAITSIGNIPVWWSALVALGVVLVGMAIVRRDWRAWVALIGYVGLYLPWFLYYDRTIFSFYTVAFVPFVVLTLVLALGLGAGILAPVPGSRAALAEQEALEAQQIGEGKVHPRGPVGTFLGFGLQPTRLRIPEAWTGVPSWRVHGEGVVLMSVVVSAAIVFAALWWPLWTGQTVSYEFWKWHMLLPSWI
ncbi:dolichyl-phosphate-mannose--protein mannosyltransferase [Actinomyces oricola]